MNIGLILRKTGFSSSILKLTHTDGTYILTSTSSSEGFMKPSSLIFKLNEEEFDEDALDGRYRTGCFESPILQLTESNGIYTLNSTHNFTNFLKLPPIVFKMNEDFVVTAANKQECERQNPIANNQVSGTQDKLLTDISEYRLQVSDPEDTSVVWKSNPPVVSTSLLAPSTSVKAEETVKTE